MRLRDPDPISSPDLPDDPSIRQPASPKNNDIIVQLYPKLPRQVSTHYSSTSPSALTSYGLAINWNLSTIPLHPHHLLGEEHRPAPIIGSSPTPHSLRAGHTRERDRNKEGET
jgi:hypothetical protein